MTNFRTDFFSKWHIFTKDVKTSLFWSDVFPEVSYFPKWASLSNLAILSNDQWFEVSIFPIYRLRRNGFREITPFQSYRFRSDSFFEATLIKVLCDRRSNKYYVSLISCGQKIYKIFFSRNFTGCSKMYKRVKNCGEFCSTESITKL